MGQEAHSYEWLFSRMGERESSRLFWRSSFEMLDVESGAELVQVRRVDAASRFDRPNAFRSSAICRPHHVRNAGLVVGGIDRGSSKRALRWQPHHRRPTQPSWGQISPSVPRGFSRILAAFRRAPGVTRA